MSEFNLIQRFFTRPTPSAQLGVGDDAALLRVSPGMELAVSSDMLVSGSHFFADADPYALGHKTLAVNLSDLAAMGASARWATLAVSLPECDENWLQKFSDGFFALAAQHGVALIGGDTTRGPLNLCVTIMGEVPQGKALRRSTAGLGDDIWMSGQLGDAALALAHLQGKLQLAEQDFAVCAQRLHQPEPRLVLGQALRDIAHSAIDLSDGLLADLGHILDCSKVGAEIHYPSIAISPQLAAISDNDLRQRCVLAGGDDYELCFTAPSTCREALLSLAELISLPLSRIGVIVKGNSCRVIDADSSTIHLKETGYDHFR